MQIVAKVKKDKNDEGTKVTVEYPIHSTLDENRQAHGDKCVNDLFSAKAKIAVQDAVRRWGLSMLKEKGKIDPKALQEKVNTFKLDEKVRAPRKSPKDKIKSLLDQMTPEEKTEFLAEMRKQKS